MELHQVRYFVTLAQTLNFTRAAEACNVTQPALTRAIQRLEGELGGALVQRERNLTQLSELGRLMLPLLEQTLAAAEAAKDHAKRFRKSEVAVLRLGLVPSISPRVVAGVLAELLRRMPSLEIELKEAPQDELVIQLMEGELDAALLVEAGEFPERIDRWPLFAEGYRVAFAAGHRFAAMERVPASAICSEIVVRRPACDAASRLQALAETNQAPMLRHLGATEEQIQHLAALSLGIALVPEHLPVLPALATRPVSGVDLRRKLVLAAVGGRRHSPALDTFLKLSRARNLRAELGMA